MNKQSKWHYPRTDLATAYLQQLEAGLNSIAIFAERRKGKTEFLLEDLTPIAKEKGLRTAYINFWERKSDPVYCVTQGIRRSIETDSPRKWKNEFSLKLGIFQSKTTIDSNKYPEIAGEALDMLLSSKGGGVLLMFDEIQHLASDPSYEELIATLRTFLDTNKKRVRAVFTGSSQDRLNTIFRKQKAAFYRGASLVEFPDMGDDFVDFLLANFHDITKRKLQKTKGYEIFEDYNYSPFLIVDLLQTMMREAIFDLNEGLEYYRDQHDPNEEWQELWESLKQIDQLILREIIIGLLPLYHKESYALISDKLGLDKVTRGMIQSSINRLREQGILNNEGHGQWAFESTAFEGFVLSL